MYVICAKDLYWFEFSGILLTAESNKYSIIEKYKDLVYYFKIFLLEEKSRKKLTNMVRINGIQTKENNTRESRKHK